MRTDSPDCQLDPVRVTVLPSASFASSLWIVCAGNVLALGSAMSAPSPWIAGAGDVLPCGLALGSAMSALSLWFVGDVLPPRLVMSAITIAGAASSAPHTSRPTGWGAAFRTRPPSLLAALFLHRIWRGFYFVPVLYCRHPPGIRSGLRLLGIFARVSTQELSPRRRRGKISLGPSLLYIACWSVCPYRWIFLFGYLMYREPYACQVRT